MLKNVFSRIELETWQANSLEEGTLKFVSAKDQELHSSHPYLSKQAK